LFYKDLKADKTTFFQPDNQLSGHKFLHYFFTKKSGMFFASGGRKCSLEAAFGTADGNDKR
jgi:hypothetical protein